MGQHDFGQQSSILPPLIQNVVAILLCTSVTGFGETSFFIYLLSKESITPEEIKFSKKIVYFSKSFTKV